MGRVIGVAIGYVVGVVTGNWWVFAGALVSTAQESRARRRARQQYNSTLEDRLEMVDVQAAPPRTLVLGRARAVEGVRFPAWTSGANGEKLTMIVGFAGHEIDGFEQIYFNDTAVSLDAGGWVTTPPFVKGDLDSVSQQSLVPVVVLPVAPVPASVQVVVTVGTGVDQQTYLGGIVSIVGNTVTCVDVGQPDTRYDVTYQTSVGIPTARVRTWRGAPGQNVGADLQAEYPGKIDNTRRFEGMAVAAVDVLYDTDVYVQGRPNVTAVMRGARCYDPRLDSTVPGGAGPHRFADSATWAFTENPALHALRYATWANGWALPIEECNLQDVQAAANVCDQSTAFPVRTNGVLTSVTLPRYRCGIVISSDTDPAQAMADIMETMAGAEGWSGGVWRMRAGAMTTPAFTLDSSWLAQSVGDDGQASGDDVARITNGVPRDQRINRVTGKCIDPAQRWQALPFPAVQDAVLIAAKGLAPLEVEFSGVNHPVHAQHLASVAIREAQASLRHDYRCSLRAWGVELFDVGTINLPRFGFATNTARVIGWRWHPAEGVQLRLAEISADIYTPVAELTGRDPAPNYTAPDPRTVETITGLQVTSGTVPLTDGSVLTRTQVTWAPVVGQSVRAGGTVEVQYTQIQAEAALPSGDWSSWEESGSSTSATIPALMSGRVYLFRARAISAPPLRVRGDWSVQMAHQVALPPALSGRYTDYIFRRSATPPATPTGAGTPAGWFDTPPAADGNPLYFSVTDKRSDGSLITPWSDPVQIDGESLQVQYSVDGITGWHTGFVPGDFYARYRVGSAAAWSAAIKIVAEDGLTPVYIFQRSATLPATPTGDYPALWFDGPPAANGLPLWTSLGRRQPNGVLVGGWSVPVKIEGDSVYVEYSVDGISGWHPVFVPGDIFARYKTGPTGAWSEVMKIVGEDGQDGIDGVNGVRTAIMVLYQWASVAPVVFPSGNSTYTWATATFTTPSGAGLWTQIPGVPVSGQVLYACQQRFADTGTATTSVIGWSTGTAYVAGRSGTDGIRGNLTGYSNSVSPPVFSTAPWNGATDDANASTIIWRMRGNAGSPPNNAHLAIGDTVTLRDTGNTNVATKYWSGGAWVDPGALYSGNVIVGGTISGGTNLNIAGYAKVEGFSTLSLPDPISVGLVNRTCAVVANSAGAAQVGLVGIGTQSGGYGVFAYNSANNPALVAYQDSAGTSSGAALVRSLNGYGLQAIGRTIGVDATASGAGGAGLSGRVNPAVSGVGVYGEGANASQVGVRATNVAGGLALQVQGPASISGQLSSTVANGTAPITVLSSTKVTNLNADLLDGLDAGQLLDSANHSGSIPAARMSANVLAAIGFAPVQQGGGAGQLGNKIHIGWSATATLRLQVDVTDFGDTWPINISGRATTLNLATGGFVNATINASGGGTAAFNASKPGPSNSNEWVQWPVNGRVGRVPIWFDS
jgi:hypothetical protein